MKTGITRRLCGDNMAECYKRCARYAEFIRRDNWTDDRGNLSRATYKNATTFYRFTVLNGEVIESEWWAEGS
jgi:hypothetical protein